MADEAKEIADRYIALANEGLERKRCLFCERSALRYSKRRGERVCDQHFMTTCPKCGHEAFWMSSKSQPAGRFVCFRLVHHVCTWQSERLPETHSQPFKD